MTTLAPTATPVAGSTTTTPARHRSTLTGLPSLLRLVARRDRLRFTLWFLVIVGTVVASVASIVGLYTTQEDLDGYGRLVRGNSALIAQAGPGYGLDEPTLGAVVMNETSVWTLLSLGLMSAFMVTRHTRAEEESERAELVRAAPVGRHAPLAAAVLGVATMNVLVAAGVVAGLLAYGLPTTGTLAFGAAALATGWLFTAVTAVTAQVVSGSRASTGLAGAVLGVSYVVRAIGDVGDGRLTWLSPIGWGQAIRPYADERWWVLLLPLATTSALLTVAVVLADRRDLGAGMLRERPGRAAAVPSFDSALDLAVRLHRGSLVAWTAGMAVLAFFYGVVTDEAEQMIEENPDLADFFAQIGQGTLTEVFIATSVLMLALMASGFTVATVLRLRSEEMSVHADQLLATPTSRRAWAWSHVLVSLVGTAVVMAATGLAFGLGYAVVSGDVGQLDAALAPSLLMVPALWVLAGIAFVLHGVTPRWSLVAWAYVGLVVIVGFFGGVLDLPQWVIDLSPFQHVPGLPAADFTALPVVVLVAIAVLLLVVGTVAIERRDIG